MHFVTYLDSLTAVSAARVTESCGVWGRKLSVHRGPRPPPHPCWARPLFSSLSAVIEKYQNSPWGKDKDPFVRRGCKYKFGTCRGVYYVSGFVARERAGLCSQPWMPSLI